MASTVNIPESHSPSRNVSVSSDDSVVIKHEDKSDVLADKNREKDEICQLCNDVLTVPRILRCFHVFDQHCLEQHIRIKQQFDCIECPVCVHKTPLQPFGSSGIACLPLSLPTLVRLASKTLSPDPVISLTHRLRCTLCAPPKHAQGSFFCFDCPAFLCHAARQMHQELRVFSVHRIVRVLDLSKAEVPKELLTANCALHNRPLASFCFDCNVYLLFLNFAMIQALHFFVVFLCLYLVR